RGKAGVADEADVARGREGNPQELKRSRIAATETNREAERVCSSDADHAAKKEGTSAVEAVQKVYLGVGKMITAEEARRLVNLHGADLPMPGPEFESDDNGGSADAHDE